MANIVPGKSSLDTSDLLSRTIINLTEGITGIAASERKDLYLSLGYIFQRFRSGKFLQTLKNEWDLLREKGRIKDGYMDTEQHQECLQEMLDFLDKDSPDENRFKLLKEIFLAAATELISDRASVLPQQYMKICRALSSGKVLVLLAVFAIAKAGGWDPNDMGAQNWLNQIAEKSALQYTELIEVHERNLIDKNLITPRTHSDNSGVKLGNHFRLSNLGYNICLFIESYEEKTDT
jgi:hypothetical protein